MGAFNRLAHRALFCALLLFLSLFTLHMSEAEGETPLALPNEVRSLLIANDHFVSHDNTFPSSISNAKNVEKALLSGTLPMAAEPMIYDSALNSLQGLASAIATVFHYAKEDDLSILYISTHGIYVKDDPNPAAYLLLSDGQREARITARDIERAFQDIKGTKLIIIDACHSGAFIGKGLGEDAAVAVGGAFRDPSFKVITSAGGNEKSWIYLSQDKRPASAEAAGYFSALLSEAMGLYGEYGADINRDGQITLAEIHQYLLDHLAASTPHVYPQEDDSVIFTYDLDKAAENRQNPAKPISDIIYDTTVFNASDTSLSFSFTVHRQVQLQYVITYYREGAWEFASPDILWDSLEQEDLPDMPSGTVSPGRKSRAFTISLPDDQEAYGYAMVQIFAYENGRPSLQGSKLLCVSPVSGDPILSVSVPETFSPHTREELQINVYHQYPCKLSITIEDMDGNTMRRLVSGQGSRPQQLSPEGTLHYWTGRLADGTHAPGGQYRVRVQATIGDETYEALSTPFTLTEAEE